MLLQPETVSIDELANRIDNWLLSSNRIGYLNSIDGSQICVLLLDCLAGKVHLLVAPVVSKQYTSLTVRHPQFHWFERTLAELFGIEPVGHPRLKRVLLGGDYPEHFVPLGGNESRSFPLPHHFMQIQGEDIFELPVGPVHAGIIEPGHFRLSCLGEVVSNLEIRLGYLHRGVESSMTKVPWKQAGLLCESAASDSAVANALAFSCAVESLFQADVPQRAQYLRTIALEIERVAMHVADLGGMAVDLSYSGVAATLSRLRGAALNLAEILSGSRFMRGFVLPGGIARDCDAGLSQLSGNVLKLEKDLHGIVNLLLDNPGVIDRTHNIGTLTHSLALSFGIVGVAGRASGIAYDARRHFSHGLYPGIAPEIVIEGDGDALARSKVRARELFASLSLIKQLIETIPQGAINQKLADSLPSEKAACSIVEAFRGELIHSVFTSEDGHISRYIIKDPSVNNWTALAIAQRSNLIADFPICNKSFSLSYSGHDL